MLVQEDFQIKVMTLEAGFDPDLFIRRKGKQAYAEALKRAPGYFEYLIERTRTRFPVKTAEGKAKAATYLLPFIKQVSNPIVRDELARDMAQKLAIDSALLVNELRSAARNRGAVLKLPKEPQLTEAEKVIIRALAPEMKSAVDFRSDLMMVLGEEQLHRGLTSEALIDALLSSAEPQLVSDQDRLLASVLMHENEEVSSDLVSHALDALRRGIMERRQRELKARIAEAERKNDSASLAALLQEKLQIDRALMQAG